MNTRAAVSNAIRRGKLPPANSHACERCGFGAVMYRVLSVRPLVVRPLCFKCERQERASG